MFSSEHTVSGASVEPLPDLGVLPVPLSVGRRYSCFFHNVALLCNHAMLVRSTYDITNDRLFSPGLPLLLDTNPWRTWHTNTLSYLSDFFSFWLFSSYFDVCGARFLCGR